jgi:glycogen debranching enzyme
MAELFEATGDPVSAAEQRRLAASLADLVDQRFYDERAGFYALAIDGDKQPLLSVSSNPGHLLWCGLPTTRCAEAVAGRLTEPDLFSGWGLRTLSSQHPAYNPLSYQRGSVWPHDTMLAVAGLFRYGHREHAATLLRAVLDAACAFDDDRLPELFCGFDRADGPPIPYAEANTPQAWAAAAPILAAQVLLGLVPDAPKHRCFVNPWLPEWLPELTLQGLAIGDATIDVELTRVGGTTSIATTTPESFEVILGQPAAPLWGRPPRTAEDSDGDV